MSDRGTKKHFEKVFKGGSLDGWLESGKVIPLDSFEQGKKVVDAINQRKPEFPSILSKLDITGAKGIEHPVEHLKLREKELEKAEEEVRFEFQDMFGHKIGEMKAEKPCTHCGKMTRGRCSVCRKPVCERCWPISREYHLERGENPSFEK